MYSMTRIHAGLDGCEGEKNLHARRMKLNVTREGLDLVCCLKPLVNKRLKVVLMDCPYVPLLAP